MASYILTNKAVEDLSKIWDYTFEVWSEVMADKYYTMLLDSCQDLADGKAWENTTLKLARKFSDLELVSILYFTNCSKITESKSPEYYMAEWI